MLMNPGTAALLILALLAPGGSASMGEPGKVTVLFPGGNIEVERNLVQEGHLWLPAKVATKVNGLELKPVGLCALNLCLPLPADGGWTRRIDGTTYLDLTAVANHVDQAWVRDVEREIWSFSTVPALRSSGILSGRAPDFALPDREGRTVKLSDFRGSKVLLLTWASW